MAICATLQLIHVMGPPRDAYVYHYSFDHSRFVVVVVRMLFTTQQRLQYQFSKALPRCETFPEITAEYT